MFSVWRKRQEFYVSYSLAIISCHRLFRSLLAWFPSWVQILAHIWGIWLDPTYAKCVDPFSAEAQYFPPPSQAWRKFCYEQQHTLNPASEITPSWTSSAFQSSSLGLCGWYKHRETWHIKATTSGTLVKTRGHRLWSSWEGYFFFKARERAGSYQWEKQGACCKAMLKQ